MLKIALILSGILFLSACTPSSDGAAGGGSGGLEPAEFSGRPGDCKKFIADLPADYFHNWVTVPEDPSNPGGRQITVFYYGEKRSDLPRVIFFNGGPGSNSHGSHKGIASSLEKENLTNKVSMVFMDQRGTGCSSAYPQGNESEVVLRAIHYGTRGIVNDAEAIRKIMQGSEPWKVYGQSYGAFIIHRYVELFPESITRAIAHANAISADPMVRLSERIYSQARVWEQYFTVYPEDRARFEKLRAAVGAEDFCVTEDMYQNTFCGMEIMETFVYNLGFSYTWEWTHYDLIDLADDAILSSEKLRKYLAYYGEPATSMGTRLSISTIGVYDRNVANSDSVTCAEVRARIQAKYGVDITTVPATECSGALQFDYAGKNYEIVKSILGSARDLLTIAGFKQGLLQMKPGSFYLYAGVRDSYVPMETFVDEVTQLGNLINYTLFPNSGHEGYRSEKQVLVDLTN